MLAMNRRLFLSSAVGTLAAQAAPPAVTFSKSKNKIDVAMGGQPAAGFHYEAEWDKPFLWPIRTTGGVVVTRQFPMEKVPGEAQDHTWQRGLWFAHGDINGVDFWRELGREKTGIYAPRADPRARGNTISVDLDMLTPAKKSLGCMRQEYGFSRAGDDLLIDARAVIMADRGAPLKMGDTEEGWFGFRMHDAFREDRGAAMRNSEGETGKKIWGKRARWQCYAAAVDGQKISVLMFDHPKNPKHPTYWHARHYALCAANPFGEHDFLKDKTRDGSMSIPEGGKLEFRYRVVIHPGDADQASIDRLYAAFR